MKYSDPKAIEISLDYSTNIRHNYNEAKLRIFIEDAIKSELKQLNSQTVIHREFETGEFTMLFDPQSAEECEVKLIFHGNCSNNQAVEAFVYWESFLPFLQKKIAERGIQGFFLLDYKNMVSVNSLTLKCLRKDVLKNIEFLFDLIKNFRPSEADVSGLKPGLETFLGDYLKNVNPFFSLYPSLLNFLADNPTTYEYLKN